MNILFFHLKGTSQNIQSTTQQQQQQQPAIVPQQQTQQSNQPMSIEESLLQGQPPGTVIKCVTAQVIQTEQGPRIVLQGLVGNDFTQQQLALVQQQVKQQLLKGMYITFLMKTLEFFTINMKTKLVLIKQNLNFLHNHIRAVSIILRPNP